MLSGSYVSLIASNRIDIDAIKMGCELKSVTIRNIPDEVHRAIRLRAQYGRSVEAELRTILEAAVRQPGRVKLGSLLTDIGRQVNLTEDEFAAFESARDTSPARAASFEE